MSEQSTLADGTAAEEVIPDDEVDIEEGVGMAEELAAAQRSISVAEFFEQNKQMLGFDSRARAIVTAVKEGVDNGLDAAEEAGIPPEIIVEISRSGGGDHYTVAIEDNGPGILPEQIPKVFGQLLYGSRFHTREQNRGQQGLGISAAVLYAQLTTGSPARVTSRSIGSDTAHRFELTIDTESNEPVVRDEGETEWGRSHGTRIELDMDANMRARSQLLAYLRQNAIVNPHATIRYRGPKEEFTVERATDDLPPATEEILPHPHGVQLGTVKKLLESTDSYSLSGFLDNEFCRVGPKSAAAILDGMRDRLFGREGAWEPTAVAYTEIRNAVADAVVNKPADETEAFADRVAEAVVGGADDYCTPPADGRWSATALEREIPEIAAATESESDSGTRFGDTVCERAARAAWDVVADQRGPDVRAALDEATTSRREDDVLATFADRLAATFEDVDRHRVTRRTLADFVDQAADTVERREDVRVGDTARENIVDRLWADMHVVDDDVPSVKETAADTALAGALIAGMREADLIAPPSDCLSPVGEAGIRAGLENEYDADFYAASSRGASVHGGDPFVAEAGIAYGGDLDEEGTIELLRFANRVPLVYQAGACLITDEMQSMGWRNYKLSQSEGSLPKGPAVLMVHVASTNVPFTSESKDALAAVPEIEEEVERAVREAARKMKSHIKDADKRRERRRKESVLDDILPEMARKVAETADREEPATAASIARVMNNLFVFDARDGAERPSSLDEADASVSTEGGAIEVWNFANSGSSSVTVTATSGGEPTVGDGAEVVSNGDGEWRVTWEATVAAGEAVALPFEGGDDEIGISVDGIADERVTIDGGADADASAEAEAETKASGE